MKQKPVIAALVFAGALLAQGPEPIPPVTPLPAPFPLALRLYLDLSETQVETIRHLNSDYARLSATRLRRINQVQQEIAEETARQPLDPMALGLRYAEIETIRRQLQNELATTRTKIRQSLTDPQRAKLKILEDAIKLLPLYSEAVSVNLLEPSEFGPQVRGGVPSGVIVGP